MSDDLVKRGREWNFCWPSHDVEMLVPAMADRIEELEAKLSKAEVKLAKAVGALGDIYDGEPEWPDEPEKELEWCRNRAKRTLAELKGQNQ